MLYIARKDGVQFYTRSRNQSSAWQMTDTTF